MQPSCTHQHPPTDDRSVPTIMWSTFIADLETPVSAYLKLCSQRRFCCLFESVEGGRTRGRYSILALDPDVVWKVSEGRVWRSDNVPHGSSQFVAQEGNPLQVLREFQRESALEIPPELPSAAAGLFGYLGYDMVRFAEKLPPAPTDHLEIPDAFLFRPTLVLVFDSLSDSLHVVTPIRPRTHSPPGKPAARDLERLRAEAGERIDQTIGALATSHVNRELMPSALKPQPLTISSNMEPAAYEGIVTRGVEYTRAGDIFQVVLSQRFSFPFADPPVSLFRSLRRINPSPYMFLLEFGDFQVVGASPEILISVKSGDVVIRPLAGSRPRGTTRAEDRLQAKSLLADPKERAEHLMLLDLARNDIGRVADWGSVQVTESFAIEYYSHIMHISSNVVGRLRPGLDALDALVASLPAGTLSGAPKIRAMEIINELEVSKRGLYGGCIGYLSANGDIDTCIGLRMAIVQGGRAHVQAGSGVVADSQPATERQESERKAEALMEAARNAHRFGSASSVCAKPAPEQPCVSAGSPEGVVRT